MTLFIREKPAVFRSTQPNVELSSSFQFLRDYSRRNCLSNTRICLHAADSSDLQVMLIYHSSIHSVRIHNHPAKDEVLTIYSGSCTFKDYGLQGKPVHSPVSSVLIPGNTILIPALLWHSLVIHEDLCFMETSRGPFTPNSTQLF